MPKFLMYLTKTTTEVAEIEVIAADRDEAIEAAEEKGWELSGRHWQVSENTMQAEHA